MQNNTFDAVVLGAGSGGLTTAVGLSKVGQKVLLVEREHMGGECTNTGCVPSKALLHHAKGYFHATKIAGMTPKTETYRQEAFTYVRNKIEEILAEETPEHFQKQGITVVMGEAEFTGPESIKVGTEEYTFKKAVIATGSSPRPLDIPGLEEKMILTNQNIFDLTKIPARTLIIGGGPIGMEMGQALAMLGSQVTIIENGPRFAKLEDEAISPIINRKFEQLGIKIYTNANVTKIENYLAEVKVKDGDGAEVMMPKIAFDKVLIAIGRVPNLPNGLALAQIKCETYGITVNKNWQTANKNIYALGDVSARMKFTHVADDTARQVVGRIASKGFFSVKTKEIPKVTYTEPEIAQVGLSYKEALEEYGIGRIMRIEVPYSENDRAKTDAATEGLLVITAKRLSGKILGANIIGENAGDLIGTITVTMQHNISLYKLRSTIFAYPTLSLLIRKAGDKFFGQQIADLKTDIKNLLKRNIPKLVAVFFWLSLIIGFNYYRVSNDLSYQDILMEMLTFFTSTAYGPLIYMVLYALRPLILFPATILTALSGALFGFWWGVLYTLIGENLSANFAYWIGRYFGNDFKLEKTAIGKWVEALRKKPFESVLFMRLFYVPFDLTNYGSGILKIKWSSYFTATLIGIVPGLTTFVALGAAVDLDKFRTDGITFDAFNPAFLALSVGIFVVSIMISNYLKKKKEVK